LRQTRGAKKIPKTCLKTKLKSKEITNILVFETFPNHSIRKFSVFLEDELRIISGTQRAGKITKNRFGLSVKQNSLIFFKSQKLFHYFLGSVNIVEALE
jgi:hypothetical protein